MVILLKSEKILILAKVITTVFSRQRLAISAIISKRVFSTLKMYLLPEFFSKSMDSNFLHMFLK